MPQRQARQEVASHTAAPRCQLRRWATERGAALRDLRVEPVKFGGRGVVTRHRQTAGEPLCSFQRRLLPRPNASRTIYTYHCPKYATQEACAFRTAFWSLPSSFFRRNVDLGSLFNLRPIRRLDCTGGKHPLTKLRIRSSALALHSSRLRGRGRGAGLDHRRRHISSFYYFCPIPGPCRPASDHRSRLRPRPRSGRGAQRGGAHGSARPRSGSAQRETQGGCGLVA